MQQWPGIIPFSSSARPVTTTTGLVLFIYDTLEHIARTPKHMYGKVDGPAWPLCVKRRAGDVGLELDDLMVGGVIHVKENLWMPLLYYFTQGH